MKQFVRTVQLWIVLKHLMVYLSWFVLHFQANL